MTTAVNNKNKKTALHEIIAVEDSKKKTAERLLEEAMSQFKNNKERYEGFVRRYEPHSEDGDKLPPETKNLEDTVLNKMDYAFTEECNFIDVALIKETTNQDANADIMINEMTLAKNIPATGLLFLEKRVKRWIEILNVLPVLDSTEEWHKDSNTGHYVSKEKATVREKKELRWKVITEATKEHKAQYESWTETIPVGDWIKKRFSGAITVKEKADMIKRAKTLYEAIVAARMRANMQEINKVNVADELYKFVIGYF